MWMNRSISEFQLSKLLHGHWKARQLSAHSGGITGVSRPLPAARIILMAFAVMIAGVLWLSAGLNRTTPADSRAGLTHYQTTQTIDSSAPAGDLAAQTGDRTSPTGDRMPPLGDRTKPSGDGPSSSADLRLPGQAAPRKPGGHADPSSPAPIDPSEESAFETTDGNEPRPLTDKELAELQVNELGGVPIIMYHDIGDREGYLIRSRDNFRKDLQRFYELGYCLIPLSDYLTGDIRLPAGKSPLVITFDDGRASQLKLIEVDGEIVADPDCAVGILLDFSRKHPGFGHSATFFVNYPRMFGTESRAAEYMKFLLDNGMEIGNHTLTHRNLASASAEEVAREIGGLANEIRDVLDYDTLSLALPYGNYPKSKQFLLSGRWDDQYYRNLGVLLAGAEPAPSPYSLKFNPLAVPRIHGSDEELDKWLRTLEKYPERRYVSDGQSDTVAIFLDYGLVYDIERVGDLKVRAFATPVETAEVAEDATLAEAGDRGSVDVRDADRADGKGGDPLEIRDANTADTGDRNPDNPT